SPATKAASRALVTFSRRLSARRAEMISGLPERSLAIPLRPRQFGRNPAPHHTNPFSRPALWARRKRTSASVISAVNERAPAQTPDHATANSGALALSAGVLAPRAQTQRDRDREQHHHDPPLERSAPGVRVDVEDLLDPVGHDRRQHTQQACYGAAYD